MSNIPGRTQGHLQYLRYFEGRFPREDQRDPQGTLIIYTGDTVRLEFEIRDQCKNVVDLTEYKITFTAKCQEWNTEALYSVNSVDDPKHVVKTYPTEGVVLVLIEAPVTRTWDAGQLIYDVELSKESVDPELAAEVYTVVRAWGEIRRDVTGYVAP